MNETLTVLGSFARHLTPDEPGGCSGRFPDHYLLQFGRQKPLFKLTLDDGKTVPMTNSLKITCKDSRGKTVDEALQLYLSEHPDRLIIDGYREEYNHPAKRQKLKVCSWEEGRCKHMRRPVIDRFGIYRTQPSRFLVLIHWLL